MMIRYARRHGWKLIAIVCLVATWVGVGRVANVSLASPGPAPILLVVNDAYGNNKFGRYLGEILRAEGLNSFDVIDISAMTPAELGQHDVAILAETTLTGAQATALSNYVAGGGRLVAMRPDSQIKDLFGLGTAAGTLTDGYLKIDTTATFSGNTPGQGLTTSTLQIHGAANRYTSNSGTVLATLYSNATTATIYPAVVGGPSGRAAAFTYDLARNVVYTRQGNPANANKIYGSPFVEDAQGNPGTWDTAFPPVTRTTSLFQLSNVLTNPAWIDRDKIPIPQADEQQRLFARLVRQMVEQVRPMPQLWYFPDTAKTMLILTGDAHANPTFYYSNEIASLSAYNGKITFYISISGEPSDTDVEAWRAQGHEFGIHPYAYAPNEDYPPYDIQNLSQGYEVYTTWFGSQYSSPKSRTVRNHQVAWQGWTDAADLAVAYGLAMSTDFYHWGGWLQKPDGTWPHGYITGSGQPMKFIRADGTILPYYQQLTELVDEQLVNGAGAGFEGLSNAQAVTVSRELIDASLAGDYAALMTQFHVDYFTTAQTWIEGTLAYANAHGVPLWNADDWLSFTETRHDADYTNVAWATGTQTLSFNLAATSTAGINLTTMLPLSYGGNNLLSVTVDGLPHSYSVQTVNGVNVAFVSVPAGDHAFTALYPGPTSTPTITDTPTQTFTPSPTQTSTPTYSPTPVPTNTPSPTITDTPTRTPTATATSLPAQGNSRLYLPLILAGSTGAANLNAAPPR
jgi:hypothetical protein